MSDIRKYLNNAQERVMNQYSNADGFLDGDLSFTGDDFFNANGANQAQMVAAADPNPAPTSQPYIINVSSASGAAVSNFEILGSYQYLNNSGFNANNDLVIGSVTISSGIPGVTYREMLYQFMNNPFSVGLTYLQSANASQILETLSINTRDANGNLAQKALIPTKDPYQNQDNVLAMKQPFRVDGFTKIIVSSILANSALKVYLFPADNINLARALANKNVSKQFANPGVTGGQTIQLKA